MSAAQPSAATAAAPSPLYSLDASSEFKPTVIGYDADVTVEKGHVASTDSFTDSPSSNPEDERPADFVRGIPGTIPVKAWLIVVTELCERFSYYGASLMFTQYMIKHLGMTRPRAVATKRGFDFFSYFTAILGAVVADAWLGKFKTILVFGMWYVIGLIVLLVSSLPVSVDGGFGIPGFILSTYLFIAFGTGGIKANVSTFVAEQQVPTGYIPTKEPGVYYDNALTVESVFRYFYWAINVGSFGGMLACPTIAKNVSYAAAFALPLSMFVVGLIVFAAGRSTYFVKPVQGAILIKVWRVIKYAIKNRRSGRFGHFLDAAKDVPSTEVDWDNDFVEDLKRTLRACKVFAFYPMYWALYNNMSDNFIIQGLRMKRPDWLSGDQLNVANSLVIVIAIPIFDRIVFPLLRKMGFRMGPIARITTGFIICSLAFVYVAVLQSFVYKTGPFFDFTGPNVTDDSFNDISIWIQIPPYCLIAISEIFASISGLEFAFKQAPYQMKALVMSLFLFTNCFGSLIGMIIAIWSKDPNYVPLFAVQAGLLGVIAMIFYWLFRKFDDAEEYAL
ncbi:peptide transporter PTR2-A [Ramicandelaber brevisporus]|nr:peptide transporter PTR2-A [Ramicandelaber brevisporus]